MSYVVMKNKATGMERKIKKGFSWTVFFFGGFALIARGQTSYFLIWLLLLFLFIFPGVFYGFYLAFAANNLLIDDLGRKGYSIASK